MCFSVFWRKFSRKPGLAGQAKTTIADLEAGAGGQRTLVQGQSQSRTIPDQETAEGVEQHASPLPVPAEEQLAAKALRDSLILEASTFIITVFAVQDGAILYQNHRSRAYFGDMVSGPRAAASAAGVATAVAATAAAMSFQLESPLLEAEKDGRTAQPGRIAGATHTAAVDGSPLSRLFALEPQKLLLLMEALAATAQDGSRRGWKGVIRVPPRVAAPRADGDGAHEAAARVAESPLPASAATRAEAFESGSRLLFSECGSSGRPAGDPASPWAFARGPARGPEGAAVATDGTACLAIRDGCLHGGQQPAPGSGPRWLSNFLRSFQGDPLRVQQQGGDAVSCHHHRHHRHHQHHQHQHQHHQQQQQHLHNHKQAGRQQRCSSQPLGSRAGVVPKPPDTLCDSARLCDDDLMLPCDFAAITKTGPISGCIATSVAATGSYTGLPPAPYVPCRPQSGILSSTALISAPQSAVQYCPHSGAMPWLALRPPSGGADGSAPLPLDAGVATGVAGVRHRVSGTAPGLATPGQTAAARIEPPARQWVRPLHIEAGGAAMPSTSVCSGSTVLLDGAAAEHLEEAINAGSGPLATSVLAVTLSENPSLAKTLSIRHLSYGLHAPPLPPQAPQGSGSDVLRPELVTVAPGAAMAVAAEGASSTVDADHLVEWVRSPPGGAGEPRNNASQGVQRPTGSLLRMPLMPPIPPVHPFPPPPQQQHAPGKWGVGGGSEGFFAQLLPRVVAAPPGQLGPCDGPCLWPRRRASCQSGASDRDGSLLLSVGGSGGDPGGDVRSGRAPAELGSGPVGLAPARPSSPGFESAGLGPELPANVAVQAQAGSPHWSSRPVASRLHDPAHSQALQLFVRPHPPQQELHHHHQQQQQCTSLASGSSAGLARRSDFPAPRLSGACSSGGDGHTAACSLLDERMPGPAGDVSQSSWGISANASPFSSVAILGVPYSCCSPVTEPAVAASIGFTGSVGGWAASAATSPAFRATVVEEEAAVVADATAPSVFTSNAGLTPTSRKWPPQLGELPAAGTVGGRNHGGLASQLLDPAILPRPNGPLPPAASAATPAAAATAASCEAPLRGERSLASSRVVDEMRLIFARASSPAQDRFGSVPVAGSGSAMARAVAGAGTAPAPLEAAAFAPGDDSELAGWRKRSALEMLSNQAPAALAATGPVREARDEVDNATATAAAAFARSVLQESAAGSAAFSFAAAVAASAAAGEPAEAALQPRSRAGDDAQRGLTTDVSDETEWGVIATFRQSALACGARSQGQQSAAFGGTGTGSGSDRDSPEVLSLQAALGAVTGRSAAKGILAAAAVDPTAQQYATFADNEEATVAPASLACVTVQPTQTKPPDSPTPLQPPPPQQQQQGQLLSECHMQPLLLQLSSTSRQQEQRRPESLLQGQTTPPQQQQQLLLQHRGSAFCRWGELQPQPPPSLPQPPRAPSSPLPGAPPPSLLNRALLPVTRGQATAAQSKLSSALMEPARTVSMSASVLPPAALSSLPPAASSPLPPALSSNLLAAPGYCWHRIIASPAQDPVSGRQVVVVMQDDVTCQVLLERRLGLMTETEHRLLEQLYPPHILRHLAEELVAQQTQMPQQPQQEEQQLRAQRLQSRRPRLSRGGGGGGGGGDAHADLDVARGAGGGGGPAGGAWGAAPLSPERLNRRLQQDAQRRRSSTAGTRATSTSPSSSLRLSPPLHDPSYTMATMHPKVTLLFADIKGFTPLCKEIQPWEVMGMLNELFSRFDALLDKFNVRKVETIGDAYFVAGGLKFSDADPGDGGLLGGCNPVLALSADTGVPAPGNLAAPAVAPAATATPQDPSASAHALNVIGFARAMLAAARQVAMPTSGEPLQIRVGIHTGPVVSGLLGSRMPRFCLFGSAVAAAARMESTGEAGAVHISEETYRLLPGRDRPGWMATSGIEVKGFGRIQTYLWRHPGVRTVAAAGPVTAVGRTW